MLSHTFSGNDVMHGKCCPIVRNHRFDAVFIPSNIDSFAEVNQVLDRVVITSNKYLYSAMRSWNYLYKFVIFFSWNLKRLGSQNAFLFLKEIIYFSICVCLSLLFIRDHDHWHHVILIQDWTCRRRCILGLLTDTQNFGLRWGYRKRIPCHCGLAIPTWITARASRTPGSLTSDWNRWRVKRSWHSRRMRNPQFCWNEIHRTRFKIITCV